MGLVRPWILVFLLWKRVDGWSQKRWKRARLRVVFEVSRAGRTDGIIFRLTEGRIAGFLAGTEGPGPGMDNTTRWCYPLRGACGNLAKLASA